MKISSYLKLGVTQHEIDFIDIDIDNDTPLFIDPHFLATRTDSWSKDATRSIRSFFRHFLTLVRLGKRGKALELFRFLREPNETRLGLSRRRSQGRGVGDEDAQKIFDSLLASKAVKSGLVEGKERCQEPLFPSSFGLPLSRSVIPSFHRVTLCCPHDLLPNGWPLPMLRGSASTSSRRSSASPTPPALRARYILRF
jgi:hypothetical protein